MVASRVRSPHSGKPVVAIEEDESVVERNYEANCPPLYDAIEKARDDEDWETILNFLENGPKPGSTVPTPEEQAKMWVTRFVGEDNTTVKWSQLPLHLAIVCGAPYNIIKNLVNLNPQALRCTDDQHMLPLHLALRYGASDDTVVLLLEEFPDAVNAKGKNGRSSIDCALKAESNSRGRMLKVFIDKTKSRLSKSVLNDRAGMKAIIEEKSNQIDTLKTELEAQYGVVDKLRKKAADAQVEAMLAGAEKRQIENQLRGKMDQVEKSKVELEEEAAAKAGKLKTEKIVETLALQKRVQELEAEKRQLAQASMKSRDGEASLRKELLKLQKLVASSVSPDDLASIKEEVQSIRAGHFAKAREETQQEYEQLKSEVESKVVEAKRSEASVKLDLEGELKQIKKSVAKLNPDLKTDDDLLALREEVKKLRAELHDHSEASQAKVEVAVLKKSLETELQERQGKTQKEVEALRKVLALANTSHRSNDELAQVKAELEAMKKEMAINDLANSTQKDVDDLQKALKKLTTLTGGSKALSSLETKVKIVGFKIGNAPNADKVIALQAEVEPLKEEMKIIQACANIQMEVTATKESIDEAMVCSQGKVLEALTIYRKMVKSLCSGLEKKSAEDILEVKNKLAELQKDLKQIEYAGKTQRVLFELKGEIESQVQKEYEIMEKDIACIKTAIDSIDMDARKAKELKKSMADEVMEIHKSKQAELLDFQKSVDAVEIKKIGVNDTETWFDVRRKIDGLRSLLQEKKVIEISDMENELLAMKKVAAAVEEDKQARSVAGVAAIRAEMKALKAGIKSRQHTDATIKTEIENLKAQVIESMPVVEKKAGMKKLLPRRFSRTNSSIDGSRHKLSVIVSDMDRELDENDIMDDTVNIVPTRLPPSLSITSKSTFGDNVSEGSSDDSSRRSELTSSKKKKLPPKFSGSVASMSLASKKSAVSFLADPVRMNRTMSKALVQETGEVELEAISAQ